jgi:uncharacterized protein YndB with AHSA1/START domain
MTELSLTTSRVIAAPKEAVFEAWLNPAMLARFMTPGPNVTVPKAEVDPVEGGRFDLVMQAGDDPLPHGGIYKEISRHDRLVFTWESPFSMDGSTVTLDFKEVDGGTDVTLTHVKFVSEESRDNHKAGWTAILEALAGAMVPAGA